jgi:hypothetical protein
MKTVLPVLLIGIALLGSAILSCSDSNQIVQPGDPEVIVDTVIVYTPIPWGLDVNDYYYFSISSAGNIDTLWARLMFVDEDSASEDGWREIFFGCESGCNEIRISHAQAPF